MVAHYVFQKMGGTMQLKLEYEGNWVGLDKILMLPTGTWRDRRPVAEAVKCTHCGLCYIHCPCGCMADELTHFVADLKYCKGCGICAQVCPTGSLIMVKEVTE